jgi:hypothetical protein
MRVRFTKGPVSSKHDLLACTRPDGSETRGDMPRQGILPHDAIHFVVEQTLGWSDAFFGHIARGAEVAHVTTRLHGEKVDWSQATQALQSESLVECLQAEAMGWSGLSRVVRPDAHGNLPAPWRGVARSHGRGPRARADRAAEFRSRLASARTRRVD